MKKFKYIILIILAPLFSLQGQSLEDLDDYSVEKFYKKLELDYGTLDDDGEEIDFVFIETELDRGKYQIELSDGPGDLYHIKDTDIYITFSHYFGYAGYGTECILEVTGGYYSATLYKLE